MSKRKKDFKKDFEEEEDDYDEEHDKPRKKSGDKNHFLQKETIQGIFAIIAFIAGIFFTMAAFDKAGVVGGYSHKILVYLFGVGYFLVPTFFFILTLAFIKNMKQHFTGIKVLSALLAFTASLGIIDIIFTNTGGVVGYYLSTPLVRFFEVYASIVILSGILIISLIMLFDARLDTYISSLWQSSLRLFKFKKDATGDEAGKNKNGFFIDEAGASADYAGNTDSDNKDIRKGVGDNDTEDTDRNKNRKDTGQLKINNPIGDGIDLAGGLGGGGFAPGLAGLGGAIGAERLRKFQNYTPIPLSLLENDKGKPGVGDIKANANIIKRTLQNFGIDVEMDEISIGPSVTRYALKPAEGVKLSKIVTLHNDLSLALAAHPLRIEAPIPGKSLVGIELPNSVKTTVGLGSLLSSKEFQESDKPLLVTLGKGVSGKSHFANLAKMPHTLIAGATGSGKSITIHVLITSLLYRNSPENLKFIMIDPKRVELTLYNKIPHLLTPVITDPKKAILSLKWAAKEMERRYDILQNNAVTNIESYHKNVLEPALKKESAKDVSGSENPESIPDTMPYIVIVIDELADIMQTYPRELESAIVRLAQMSRAVGIHLLISTQRPSVNVITGLIKANVPARIALQVASQIDSRTILDGSGAEKLLGAGDMLFQSGDMSKPVRIQCPFISETELKAITKFLAEHYEIDMPTDITINPGDMKDKDAIFQSSFNESDGDDDELYEEAKNIVMTDGKASTSFLQRKLRIGYSRAARLMDILEEKGVIGPADGSKARMVIGFEREESSEEVENTI